MRWASAISRQGSTALAVQEAVAEARRNLGDLPVDLVLLFLSPDHLAAARDVAQELAAHFPRAVRIGCSAQSCIGAGREVEEGPGLSLTLASLPGVVARACALPPEAVARAGEVPARWRELSAAGASHEPVAFVLLGDPFTADVEAIARGLESAHPGAVLVGGLASGARQPGGNRLLLGDEWLHAGALALSLSGNVLVDTLVAQGCRPVGEPMFVTRCQQNVIFELDGRPPLEVLNELAAKASPRELRLFQSSLFIGLQMNPEQAVLGRGDFLVRNVLGADRETGGIAVGALVEETQVVQFQLRDGETAAEDLALRLAQTRASLQAEGAAAHAALLFSCLGRGRGMYGSPNHDSDLFRGALGDVSVSGFFCNGEIGPVGGRTFLHGYTSAFAIFRPGR